MNREETRIKKMRRGEERREEERRREERREEKRREEERREERLGWKWGEKHEVRNPGLGTQDL